MADTLEVRFGDGSADDDFYARLVSLEVEENADLPGAVQLTLPIATETDQGTDDLTDVGEERFKPYGRIAVVVTPDGATQAACIFDGYILSHRIHLDPGTTASTLRVWGQDVSCLMNLKDRVKEWKDTTDVKIAKDIFGKYPFIKDNSVDDGGSTQYTEKTQTVMQRATDAQFLRDRARRSGRLFRVCCEESPGSNKGYFIKPSLEQRPTVTLTLNPPDAATVESLDFEWDVARPSSVLARALFADEEAEIRDTSESGLRLLDSRSLAEFIGGEGDSFLMESRLTATAASGAELGERAASVLREAGWFVRCEGEADLASLNAVLRAATVVQIDGAGQLHSGLYFVWSVRHTITPECHKMRFVLVRNAVGAASA